MRVALTHRSLYQFDRPIWLSPHEIRLRPPADFGGALDYDLQIYPSDCAVYWYQDAVGNRVARVSFPERSQKLELVVRLRTTLIPVNPFHFLIEGYAERFPFTYADALREDLKPYLRIEPCGPLTQALLADIFANCSPPRPTINVLVDMNRMLYERIAYCERREHGVQTPEQTLQLNSGSCRDSAWLFIQLLRHLGLAARFVSGYQIQLNGAHSQQSAELHAWVEVYLPGAGWIGFDPTLGLLSAENYIPVAVASTVSSAAPVIGRTEQCVCTVSYDIQIERLSPRAAQPVSQLHDE